ncbi:MAG: hypothetical protein M0Z52_07915 [Actinomycetota bacterium]|nr:hypothetical protein [Actinomycetota bacterium]
MKKSVLILVLAMIAALAVHGPAWADGDKCVKCHKDKAEGKVVHPAVQMGCTACHTGVDASTVPHKFTGKLGLSAQPPDLCFQCHTDDSVPDDYKFHRKDVHPPVAQGMCTFCHNPHVSDNDKLLNYKIPDLCFNCHDQGMFTKKTVHPPVAAGMCMKCHYPHSSDNEKLLRKEPPDLCFGCHDKKRFKGKNVHPPVAAGMCTYCHNPHSSNNMRMLNYPIPQLCFTCHDDSAMPDDLKFHKKVVHPPVAAGQCLKCHVPHANRNDKLLRKPVPFLCRGCHPEIWQGPHVIGGFSAAGHPLQGPQDPKRKGKPFNCLSCHVPHSSDWGKLWRYKAQHRFDLCTNCHSATKSF